MFWIRNTYDERSAIEWSNMDAMVTEEARRRRVAAMSEGTKGHDLWPGLDVRPEDEIVRKYRFSAFLPGTSELPYRLRARGFDTVLIAGTVTNVCCESSARNAMMSNFKTIMVTDANAAMTKAERRGVAHRILSYFRRRNGYRHRDPAIDAEYACADGPLIDVTPRPRRAVGDAIAVRGTGWRSPSRRLTIRSTILPRPRAASPIRSTASPAMTAAVLKSPLARAAA